MKVDKTSVTDRELIAWVKNAFEIAAVLDAMTAQIKAFDSLPAHLHPTMREAFGLWVDVCHDVRVRAVRATS